MARITIFDTTLRDGEQSPGASMSAGEKLRLAHEIAALGVDVVEAGFAASSRAEAESVREIGRELREPTVATLARATPSDVSAAARALELAASPRIHTFIATSDIHLTSKLCISRAECVDRAVAAIEQALRYVDDVEFSAEDAMRTDIDFLCEVVAAAVSAGASTINVPDTVGYALPHEIARTIETLSTTVPDLAGCVLSTHCHDDLGLAVANSLAAVDAGARQVECTINGIGERAGNAALEEVVMALQVRGESLGHRTGVRTERLYRTSRLLSHVIGVDPQPNKAIVGRNAFSHEAGIHQHGVMENPQTYEIMTPEMVGAPGSRLVLGKHSGRRGIEARYAALGYTLTPDEVARVTEALKDLADRKKEIVDEDLVAVLHHEVGKQAAETFRMSSLQVHCGDQSSEAVVAIEIEGGGQVTGEGRGDGPIAAVFAAIDSVVDLSIVLEALTIRSATPGQDALGEVAVQARIDERTYTGRGAHTDVVRASAEALLHAANKAAAARQWEAPHLERVDQGWGA